MRNSKQSHSFQSIQSSKFKKETFWKGCIKNGVPSFQFDRALLSDFLEKMGYRSYSSFGNVQVVQLLNGIVFIKTPQDIFNDLLILIKEQKNDLLRSCFIEQGENLLLVKKAILGSLPLIELDRYRDTRKTVHLFYQNGIIKITKSKRKAFSYKKFGKRKHYIFSEQIIRRNIKLIDRKNSDIKKFISLVTNDDSHFNSVCSAIGYLVSSYKNPSLVKAIIITDILSQVKNDAYGRSGKGILVKVLSKIINVTEYNGKVTDLTNDKFVFQNVNLNTTLIVLQDVTKGFLFESLFSTLTDNMSIERKHRPKINMPFTDSPKIALTTNYTIPQETDSFKDRKHLVTLNNFFNAKNKPEKYFKHLLFEWDDDEWNRFDNFIIECVQLFLKKGLITYESEDLKLKKLINQTSRDFVHLMNTDYDRLNDYFGLKELAQMLEVDAEEPRTRSKLVSQWIDLYAIFKGYKVEKRKSAGVTKICFKI